MSLDHLPMETQWHIERMSDSRKEYRFPDDCTFAVPSDVFPVDCSTTLYPHSLEWTSYYMPCHVSETLKEDIEKCKKEEEKAMLPDECKDLLKSLEGYSLVQKDEACYIISDNKLNKIFRPAKFMIKQVIFNNPATIVYWKDDTKTIVTCMDNVVDGRAKPAETYSKEMGLALCFMKKALGNKGNYNNEFREWITED